MVGNLTPHGGDRWNEPGSDFPDTTDITDGLPLQIRPFQQELEDYKSVIRYDERSGVLEAILIPVIEVFLHILCKYDDHARTLLNFPLSFIYDLL